MIEPKCTDKFTKARRDQILKDIYSALPYELVAEGNGLTEDTLMSWIMRGNYDLLRNVDSEYATFAREFKRKEIERIKMHLDAISKRPKFWQADAWMLERCWYRYFSANTQLMDLRRRVERLDPKEFAQSMMPNRDNNA